MTEKNDSRDDNQDDKIIELSHHQQLELCRTRPAYRQGRSLTAVKTYTVSSESTHLLIFGVPKINLRQELKNLLQRHGKIVLLNVSDKYPTEQFTECFHVCYKKVQSARIAKKLIDMKNFYGGSLHVCYAPELESVAETRYKLLQRKIYVQKSLLNIKISNENAAKIKSLSKCSLKNDHIDDGMGVTSYFQNMKWDPDSKTYVKSNSMYAGQKMKWDPNSETYINSINAVQNTFSNQSNNDLCLNHENGNETSLHTQQPQDLDEVSESNIISTRDIDEPTTSNAVKRSSNETDNVYVFKRKKKRRKKNERTIRIESNKNSDDTCTKVIASERDTLVIEESGRVTTYEDIIVPKIRTIPTKTANKINIKINAKLI